MKKIFKSKEPESLKAYKKIISNFDDEKLYENFNLKSRSGCLNNKVDNLRRHLLEDQGYICCYCMARIDCNYSKIEHLKPQSKALVTNNYFHQIDYQNLFIACCGKNIDKKAYKSCETYGNKNSNTYCDTFKKEKELNYVNLLSDIQGKLKYKKNGEIYSENLNINKEINGVLNLNCKTLKNNRKVSYYELIILLNKKLGSKKTWSRSSIKVYIDKYKNRDSKNKFKPLSEMFVYFLEKIK